MPNYCDNELTVTGPPKKLREFRLKVSTMPEDLGTQTVEQQVVDRLLKREDKEGRIIDADRIKPYPEGLNYDKQGYNWCRENWGTKWNFVEPTLARRIEGDPDKPVSLHYKFLTAWSPPTPLVQKMGEMFPELRFVLNYWEGGVGFQGSFIVENGAVTKDESEDYSGRRGG